MKTDTSTSIAYSAGGKRMLTSLAIIFLLGLLLSSIFQKFKLPGLLGVMLAGIILSEMKLLDASIINISGDLRKIALVIILTRAGLSLDISELKRVGRPAILMCFVPACFEMAGVTVIAPQLFDINYREALLMGAVIAAVSPAVIVPRMIKLIEEGYGTNKSIPQLILAGAAVDDVFVIVVFTACTSLLKGQQVSAISFIQVPVSIILGIGAGMVLGGIFNAFVKKVHIRDTAKIVIFLSISFLLIELEHQLEGIIPLSGLLGIMSMGVMIFKINENLAKRLSVRYNKLWVAAEILLFALVGASVNLSYVKKAGWIALIIVMGGLVFRLAGVLICLIKTDLNKKERVFCMAAYMPKATVQAAIGAVPLSMGLACGQKVLTVAVLSILITAPIGAIFVDNMYKKLLKR